MRALLFLPLVACGSDAPPCVAPDGNFACVTWSWSFRDPVTNKTVDCPPEVDGIDLEAWYFGPAPDAGVEYRAQGGESASCGAYRGTYVVNRQANHLRVAARSVQGVYGFIETTMPPLSLADGDQFSGVIDTRRGYVEFGVMLFSTNQNAPRGCGSTSDLGPMHLSVTSTNVSDPNDTTTDLEPCGDHVLTSGLHPGTYNITVASSDVMLRPDGQTDTGQHTVVEDQVTDGGMITIAVP